MDPREERSARRLGAAVVATFSLFAALSFGVAFVRTDAATQAAHTAQSVAGRQAAR